MKLVLTWAIKFYKRALSPLLPHACRFTPSCSSFFLEAVQVHGFFRGILLGFRRIGKCHPFSSGGYDPIPVEGSGLPARHKSVAGQKHKG